MRVSIEEKKGSEAESFPVGDNSNARLSALPGTGGPTKGRQYAMIG